MRNAYQTTNLYEASFLICKGFHFISKDASGRKTVLIFPDSKELRETITAFYAGEFASAKKLFAEYRTLKDFVFS